MSLKNKFSWEMFAYMPVIGIMRNLSLEVCKGIIPFYQKAGFTTLEVTLNSDGALDTLRYLTLNYPTLNIGAGTVLEIADLNNAVDAGASFIVTPILNEDVISVAVKNKVPVFPGALTPTEVYKASKMGASMVKLFPATSFGPQYLKELQGPLGQIKLLPTGGISPGNLNEFFSAGASGVGMGSALFDSRFIRNKEYDKLFEHLKNIFYMVKNIVNQI